MGEVKLFREVQPEFSFHLADGQTVSSLKQLADLLKKLPNDVFFHHVTPDRNDFANWICDVFREPALSKKMADVRDAKKLSQTISSYLKGPSKAPKKAPAKKAVPKKVVPKKVPVKPAPKPVKVVKKVPAKKPAPKKAPVKKVVPKKVPLKPKPVKAVKKVAAKKPVPKKTSVKKVAPKKAPAKKPIKVPKPPVKDDNLPDLPPLPGIKPTPLEDVARELDEVTPKKLFGKEEPKLPDLPDLPDNDLPPIPGDQDMPAVPDESVPDFPEEKPEKKGFFSKIFGKKEAPPEKPDTIIETHLGDSLPSFPDLPDAAPELPELPKIEEPESKSDDLDGVFLPMEEPEKSQLGDLEDNSLVKELEEEKGVSSESELLGEDIKLPEEVRVEPEPKKKGFFSKMFGKKEKPKSVEVDIPDLPEIPKTEEVKTDELPPLPDSAPDEPEIPEETLDLPPLPELDEKPTKPKKGKKKDKLDEMELPELPELPGGKVKDSTPDLPELPELPETSSSDIPELPEIHSEPELPDIGEPDVTLKEEPKKGFFSKMFGKKEKVKVPDLPEETESLPDAPPPELPEMPSDAPKEEELPASAEMYGSYKDEMGKIDNMRRQADHDVRERLNLVKDQEKDVAEQSKKLDKWQDDLEKREEDIKKQKPVLQARQISVNDSTFPKLEVEKLHAQKESLHEEIADLTREKSELQVNLLQAKDELADIQHEHDALKKINDSNQALLDKEEDRIVARVNQLEEDKRLLAEKEDDIVRKIDDLEREHKDLDKDRDQVEKMIATRDQKSHDLEEQAKEKFADMVRREKIFNVREKELLKKEEKISSVKELKASVETLKKRKSDLEKQYRSMEIKLSQLERKYLSRKSIKDKDEELLARERELYNREGHLKDYEKRLRYEEKQLEDIEFKQYLSENLSDSTYKEEEKTESDMMAQSDVKSVQDLLLKARDSINSQEFDRAKALFQELRDTFEEVKLPEHQKKELYYQILELKTDIDLAMLKG